MPSLAGLASKGQLHRIIIAVEGVFVNYFICRMNDVTNNFSINRLQLRGIIMYHTYLNIKPLHWLDYINIMCIYIIILQFCHFILSLLFAIN